MLSRSGYTVETARDGSLALEKVILDRPDLMILDIDMPEINGFDVLQRVKENPATKRIPIIISTASTETRSFERAVDKNVDRYVAKPFKTEFMMRKIEEVLEEYDRRYGADRGLSRLEKRQENLKKKGGEKV